VQGKAVKKESLVKAPFSGKECICYRCLVEVQKTEIDDDHHVEEHWSTKSNETTVKSFYLKDESGDALVHPQGAYLELSPKSEIGSGRKVAPPDNIIEYLESRSIKYKGLFGHKIMRFKEYRIDEHDRLYIAGFVSKINDKGARHSIGRQSFMAISDTDEKKILSRLSTQMIVAFIWTGILGSIALMFLMLAMAGYRI
jgi:hypothetical protein